jgi:hypothetical protein
MKKIFAILAMAVSTGVFAASAQLEYQNIDGVNGGSNATLYQLTVREQITTNFAGDVAFSNQVKDNTQSLTTRAEAGLTGSYPVAGISLYTRAAVGEKFTGPENIIFDSSITLARSARAWSTLGETGFARLGDSRRKRIARCAFSARLLMISNFGRLAAGTGGIYLNKLRRASMSLASKSDASLERA